jgi:hypothetical protein
MGPEPPLRDVTAQAIDDQGTGPKAMSPGGRRSGSEPVEHDSGYNGCDGRHRQGVFGGRRPSEELPGEGRPRIVIVDACPFYAVQAGAGTGLDEGPHANLRVAEDDREMGNVSPQPRPCLPRIGVEGRDDDRELRVLGVGNEASPQAFQHGANRVGCVPRTHHRHRLPFEAADSAGPGAQRGADSGQ